MWFWFDSYNLYSSLGVVFRHEITFLINYFSWFLRLQKLKVWVKLIENIINFSSGDHCAWPLENKSFLGQFFHIDAYVLGEEKRGWEEFQREALALLLFSSYQKYGITTKVVQWEGHWFRAFKAGAEAKWWIFLHEKECKLISNMVRSLSYWSERGIYLVKSCWF